VIHQEIRIGKILNNLVIFVKYLTNMTKLFKIFPIRISWWITWKKTKNK